MLYNNLSGTLNPRPVSLRTHNMISFFFNALECIDTKRSKLEDSEVLEVVHLVRSLS